MKLYLYISYTKSALQLVIVPDNKLCIHWINWKLVLILKQMCSLKQFWCFSNNNVTDKWCYDKIHFCVCNKTKVYLSITNICFNLLWRLYTIIRLLYLLNTIYIKKINCPWNKFKCLKIFQNKHKVHICIYDSLWQTNQTKN